MHSNCTVSGLDIADGKTPTDSNVQANDLQKWLKQVIIAMISSKMARTGHPSHVAIQRTSNARPTMGLVTDAVIITDNLATALESKMDRSIGQSAIMQASKAGLRATLDIGTAVQGGLLGD